MYGTFAESSNNKNLDVWKPSRFPAFKTEVKGVHLKQSAKSRFVERSLLELLEVRRSIHRDLFHRLRKYASASAVDRFNEKSNPAETAYSKEMNRLIARMKHPGFSIATMEDALSSVRCSLESYYTRDEIRNIDIDRLAKAVLCYIYSPHQVRSLIRTASVAFAKKNLCSWVDKVIDHA